jgi:hypothetical protein
MTDKGTRTKRKGTSATVKEPHIKRSSKSAPFDDELNIPALTDGQIKLLIELDSRALRSILLQTLPLTEKQTLDSHNRRFTEEEKANFTQLVFMSVIRSYKENWRKFQRAVFERWARRADISESDILLLRRLSGQIRNLVMYPVNSWSKAPDLADATLQVWNKCNLEEIEDLLHAIKEMWHVGAVGKKAKKGFDTATALDPGGEVADLKTEVIPAMSEEQIRRLRRAVQQAQLTPPANKSQFVDDVNDILDAHKLCIQTEDKSHFRLRVSKNALGVESIKLAGRERGHVRGFRKGVLKIVPAVENSRGPCLPSISIFPK